MKAALFLCVSLFQTGSIEKTCKEVRCRPSKKVELYDPVQKELYRVESGKLPFVYENDIILLPGDEDYIEFEKVDSGYINPKLVDYALYKPKTIRFRFFQDTSGLRQMKLVTTSWLPERVAYRADIEVFSPKNSKWKRTSTCPLDSGITVFESWPFPIEKIILTNFRVIQRTDTKACKVY